MNWVWVLLCFLLLFTFNKDLRKILFKRSGAKCEDCKCTWEDGFMLEAHHIKPTSMGGRNIISNGRMLCRPCHLKAHQKLYEQALKCRNKRGINTNAYAIRKIEERIAEKGIYRYGYSKKKPPR